MDFVVVGLTLGTLAVLAGVVLLGWETGRWQRHAARADSPAAAARCLALAADRRSTGEAFLYAGAAIVLATVGALAGSLDDRTGAYFVVTTITVAAAGILLRAYIHRTRRPIPATPRRTARPGQPASSANTGISVLFAEPTLRDEGLDDTTPALDQLDVTAHSTDPGSTAPADAAIEDEPVAVAASDRRTPDETEGPEPDNHKVVG